MQEGILAQTRKAKEAALKAAILPEGTRIKVLEAMARELDAHRSEIKDANAVDVKDARANGLSETLIDRLVLNDKRIDDMVQGLRDVALLPDKVGHIIEMWKRPNGLLIGKMVVPLGCIGIIYEARPNVTADAAGICIKSGNTIVLRGGSEAFHSNKKITEVLSAAAEANGFPEGGIQFIGTTDREAVNVMITARKYIDVVIPRGGASFIETVVNNAKVPVIETGAGNCHTYVDDTANIDMAVEIVFNGKVQRPSVCNATKKVLLHKKVAKSFLERAIPRLIAAGVEILIHPSAKPFLPTCKVMNDDELYEEFLDMRLGIIIVPSLQDAINHINQYGSHHTETI
nr:glutamate-5-semialdehyde dehydrogenase [Candidatus Sigynarchaeota archaeon]